MAEGTLREQFGLCESKGELCHWVNYLGLSPQTLPVSTIKVARTGVVAGWDPAGFPDTKFLV